MVPEFLKRERYGDGGEHRSAKTRLRLAEKKVWTPNFAIYWFALKLQEAVVNL